MNDFIIIKPAKPKRKTLIEFFVLLEMTSDEENILTKCTWRQRA